MRLPTRPHRFVLALAAVGILAVACGTKADSPTSAAPGGSVVGSATTDPIDDGYGPGPGPTLAPATSPAGEPAPAGSTLRLVDSAFGQIVADGDGRALYAFTKDDAGTPTCIGNCAVAWPATVAADAPIARGGIDGTLLTTVVRPDAQASQLKLGQWPLYYFAGDSGPGEVNGQGTGGVWFVVGADGKPVKG